MSAWSFSMSGTLKQANKTDSPRFHTTIPWRSKDVFAWAAMWKGRLCNVFPITGRKHILFSNIRYLFRKWMKRFCCYIFIDSSRPVFAKVQCLLTRNWNGQSIRGRCIHKIIFFKGCSTKTNLALNVKLGQVQKPSFTWAKSNANRIMN